MMIDVDVLREHERIPDTRFIVLHRVKVVLTRNGVTRTMEFDPAHVRSLVWDPTPHGLLGLEDSRAVIFDPDIEHPQPADAGQPASYDAGKSVADVEAARLHRVAHVLDFPDERPARPEAGVEFPIFVNIPESERGPDAWYKIEGTETHAIELTYHDNAKPKPKWYKQNLPVRSTDNGVNRGQLWEYDPHSETVDMVFWDAAACSELRAAKHAAGQHVNRHRFVRPDGSTRPQHQPVEVQPQGSSSVPCALCRHYDNCVWECTAN